MARLRRTRTEPSDRSWLSVPRPVLCRSFMQEYEQQRREQDANEVLDSIFEPLSDEQFLELEKKRIEDWQKQEEIDNFANKKEQADVDREERREVEISGDSGPSQRGIEIGRVDVDTRQPTALDRNEAAGIVGREAGVSDDGSADPTALREESAGAVRGVEERAASVTEGIDGGIAADESAEAKQQSGDLVVEDEQAGIPAAQRLSSGYEIETRWHEKGQKTVYVVHPTNRIPAEDFEGLRKSSKLYHGYWSRGGRYGRSGFVFESEGDAKRFADERIGTADVAVDTPVGEMTTREALASETPIIDFGEQPLTAEEIDASKAEPQIKVLAKAYLNGETSFLNSTAYQTIYNDVRNITRDLGGNRQAADDTLPVAAADDADGRGRSGYSGERSARLDRFASSADVAAGGRGDSIPDDEDGVNGSAAVSGTGSDSGVSGEESDDAGVSADRNRRAGGRIRSELGDDVRGGSERVSDGASTRFAGFRNDKTRRTR